MLRHDFILCKTRNLLSAFLAPLMSQTDRPRQRFLRQSIGAILLAGTLVVTELAHWIHDDCSDVFYRLKRCLVLPADSAKTSLSFIIVCWMPYRNGLA